MAAEGATTKLDRIQVNVKKHLQDLEKTNAKYVARAKREIKADVAKVRKATRRLGAKLKAKN